MYSAILLIIIVANVSRTLGFERTLITISFICNSEMNASIPRWGIFLSLRRNQPNEFTYQTFHDPVLENYFPTDPEFFFYGIILSAYIRPYRGMEGKTKKDNHYGKSFK